MGIRRSEDIREDLTVEVGVDVMREGCLVIDRKGRKWHPFYKLDCSCLSSMKPSSTMKAQLQSWAWAAGYSWACSPEYAGFGIVRFRIHVPREVPNSITQQF